MKKKDRELFEFSMHRFNWDSYFHYYVRGARTYLLKDPLTTLAKGRVKYYQLMAMHYLLLTVLGYIVFKLLIVLLSYLL